MCSCWDSLRKAISSISAYLKTTKRRRMNLINWNIDKSWTLFLDRDGVINRRIVDGYVTRWDAFEFLPGVLDALKILAKRFGRIVVVSNQQERDKRPISEADLGLIHNRLVRQVEGARARIDLVLHS